MSIQIVTKQDISSLTQLEIFATFGSCYYTLPYFLTSFENNKHILLYEETLKEVSIVVHK